MGVHGLWKLLEPVGKVVPLEGMAGKVLAVDVSIWLHQAIKGVRDTQGAPMAVAHLLILFHRLCKLLFYKIKPVFVFDGGVPALKRETMATRRSLRTTAKNEATKVREKLFKNLLKHEAVRQMISHGNASELLGLSSLALPGSSVEEELYKLPPLTEKQDEDRSEEEISSDDNYGETKYAEDIHSIDVTSSDFKNLPPEVRHEILLELIETRKQNSWKNIDAMPKDSDGFSDFQMNRLLKRRAVQSSLDEAGKEMGGTSLTMKELESLLLNDPLTLQNEDFLPSKRIAQSDTARFLLIHNTDEVLNKPWAEDAKSREVTGNSSKEEGSGADEALKDIKQEELSQEEIYDLIKKENAAKLTTKLSKERKMNLTDDIVEILPLLGEKDGKIEKFEDCTNTLKIKLEKEDEEYTEKNESDSLQTSSGVAIIEDHRIDLESSAGTSDVKREEKTEDNRIGSESLDKPECSSSNEDSKKMSEKSVEYLSNAGTEPMVTQDNMNVPENKVDKVEDKPVCSSNEDSKKKWRNSVEYPSNAVIELAVAQDNMEVPENKVDKVEDKPGCLSSTKELEETPQETSPELSEESDNDFVPVNTVDTVFPEAIAPKKTDKLEIIIDTKKGNAGTDDIFSDIFDNVAETEKVHQSVEEVVEKGKEVDNEIVESDDSQILKPEMTEKDLEELKKAVEGECDDLIQEQWRQERHAQSISDQMNLDAQELLRLFGVPYVVAPMEAEAQCAILNLLGLTDGTITDDSDIWLFGGKVVYRNFFNQKKHVQQYRIEDIERYFKLSREDLIRMAMLVGSDYTSGLEGVGPVTALEILGAFPNSKNGEILSGLKSFREWLTSGSDLGPTRRSLRRKIKTTRLAPGFPSEAVVEAYMHPQVDDSKEPFSWAKPNVSLLQRYAKVKFGWKQERTDELLNPVVKKLNETKKDTTIDKYFKPTEKETFVEGTLSKRVETALRRLRNEETAIGSVEAEESEPEKKKKKRTRKESCENASTSKSQPKKREESIPQKRAMEMVFEDRKRSAIQIFKRTKRNTGKRKARPVAKEEVNLSESSSSS